MMDAERFVARVLSRSGIETGPDRVGSDYADQQIAMKIKRIAPDLREGFVSLDRSLRDRDVSPGMRLHLITAVAHLSDGASRLKE